MSEKISLDSSEIDWLVFVLFHSNFEPFPNFWNVALLYFPVYRLHNYNSGIFDSFLYFAACNGLPFPVVFVIVRISCTEIAPLPRSR